MAGGVVVTGASTGIGAATALGLVRHGFQVFGTVRRVADGEHLSAAGVTPVVMDVTDSGSIAAAHRAVVSGLAGQPLAGLVNNAGIQVAGPLEYLPLDDLRRVLEVNVVGVVAVTQAFLPELRQARGRIVNISSVSGRIALPFGGPYSASKFALEALSDSLRRELLPSGVRVVVIEPGSIATPIWQKVAQTDLARYRGTPYGQVLATARDHVVKGGERGLPASAVAEAVARALLAPRPPRRMLVVRHKLRTKLLQCLPDRLVDRAVSRRLWGPGFATRTRSTP